MDAGVYLRAVDLRLDINHFVVGRKCREDRGYFTTLRLSAMQVSSLIL